jgi:hypothetical protein
MLAGIDRWMDTGFPQDEREACVRKFMRKQEEKATALVLFSRPEYARGGIREGPTTTTKKEPKQRSAGPRTARPAAFWNRIGGTSPSEASIPPQAARQT